jgi:ABC-type transport system involved in multi-copper enzyme maturation permease subunit
VKVFNIAWLTFHEARRRQLLVVGMGLALVFLLLYALAFYAIRSGLVRQMGDATSQPVRQMQTTFTLLGLYAVNFLIVILSVLISVDTISGEIASHSIQSVLTKPLQRWEVMLGKWLGLAAIITASVALMGGGVALIARAASGYFLNNLLGGLTLMALEGWILLALTLLGGTLFSTLTNGVIVFMLFGLAFLGGWTEQVGSLLENETAVRIGIVSSLLMPTEALWRKAADLMQPTSVSVLLAGPFATASVPSAAMVVYAVIYGMAALAAALYAFGRRDL